MNLKEIVEQARASKALYAKHEKKEFGREWNTEEIYVGLVSDVGDLGRLVLSEAGIEHVQDVKASLVHEIGECLWGLAILADEYGIDMEEAFKTQLENVKKVTSKE